MDARDSDFDMLGDGIKVDVQLSGCKARQGTSTYVYVAERGIESEGERMIGFSILARGILV